jgi:hypothetical protein
MMLNIWIIYKILKAVWHTVEIKTGHSPDKKLSFLLDIVISIICLYFENHIPLFPYALVIYTFVGWWIGDYFLYLLLKISNTKGWEKREIWYLNKTGPIDKFQTKFGGEWTWFVFKSIGMIGSVLMYYVNDWRGL